MAKNKRYWKTMLAGSDDKKHAATTGEDPLEEGLKDLTWFESSKRAVQRGLHKTYETFGEEVGNSLTAGVPALYLLGLLPFAAINTYISTSSEAGVTQAHVIMSIIGISAFIITLILALLMSTVYHLMKHGTPHKRIMNKVNRSVAYFLTGGDNTFRWRTSLGYNNISGAMKGSDRNNFNGTIDLSYTHKNLIFNNQTSITTNKAINSKYGSFASYAQMNPYWPIYDDNGELIKSYVLPGVGVTSEIGNPLYNATLNTYNNSNYTQIVNNFSIEWTIINGLKLRGQFGISKNFTKSDSFYPAEHTMFDSYDVSDAMKKGSYTYGTGESFSLNGNLTLSYSRTFANKHTIYGGADFYISENNGYSYSFSAIGFPNSNLDFIGSSLGYKDGSRPSSSESKSRSLGYTANVNYSYDNRYFVDGSFRADGSSLFGGNNRFAPFWSAGIGWNIHHEDFMANQNFVSDMKLRGSVGESGSQNFSSYQALSTYAYYTNQRNT